MIILAVGVLGLAPLIVLSIEGNNLSRSALDVAELARERFEVFENPSALAAILLPYYEKEPNLSGNHGRYTRETFIWDEASDSTIPPGLCHMMITINWVDDDSLSHSQSFTTIVEK
jgi:hypothetical protein